MDSMDMAADVRKSKKYRHIDEAVVERICAVAAAKYPKRKDALKAAKNELHAVHESFLQNECHAAAFALLAAPSPDGGDARLDDTALRIMRLHASTRERLADIRAVSAFFGQYIKADSAVMDIGCGFGPFMLPFFHEPPKAYLAYDINTETVALLNAFFSKTRSALYKAAIFDAVSATPDAAVDVALLLKLLPLLQRQKKGRGFGLLETLRCQKAIVSFPLQSLTGRKKGMEFFYAQAMESGLPPSLDIVDKKVFANEVFYVVERLSASPL